MTDFLALTELSHRLPDVLVGAVLAQQVTFSLVSWLKPILLFATLVPYLWMVSKVEPDLRKYLLPVTAWNGVFLGAAVLATAVALLIPIFWVGWPVMILLLGGTLWGYWQYRDKRVPEGAKFQLVSKDLKQRMEERKTRKALAEATIRFTAKGKAISVPARETPEYAIYLQVESLLSPALERRVGRLDVVPTAAQQPVVPLHLIDGVRVKGEPLTPQAANETIDFLKKIAGLDLQDRRRRQTGEIKVSATARDAVATITVWGSNVGQSLRVDFDRVKTLQRPFDNLGLLAPQLEGLKALADSAKRHGVVLVSAPPGQGLTTTALSFLARHDAYTCNIKTLEKVVEVQLEGVDHTQFNPANPNVDFATSLQSILRRDPDVVYVSEINEPNAGRIASTPGLTGPIIYVGVPADSIQSAVAEWFRAVGDLKAASKGLVAVTQQRLIRKVCEACRQPLQPTPELLKKLGVPAGKSVALYRQNGKVQVKNEIQDCPVCQGSGYFGLTGVFEVMFVDDAMRSMLADGDFKSAYQHARREGKLILLQESALAKVREGITTPDELVRVFPPAKPQPAAQRS
jgi:general secretion pathway protein E